MAPQRLLDPKKIGDNVTTKEKKLNLNQTELARELNLSKQTISRYVKAGMPVGKDRRIDPRAARKWISANLTGKAGETETLFAARTRKETALADLRSFEARLKRGELVPAADVARDVAEMVRILRDGVLSFPQRLGPKLAAEEDPAVCVAMLKTEIEQLLRKLSAELLNHKPTSQRTTQ